VAHDRPVSSLAIAALLAPIVGGSVDAGDPAVVHVEVAGAICSGALIAPTVVLTAAHCVIPGESGTVSVGPAEGAFTETASIVDAIAYRYYDGQGTADLGLLRLDAPLSPAPLTYRRVLVPALDEVRVVGYGRTQPDESGSAGTKHEVTLAVHAMDGPLLVVGTADDNTCTGDSGGPALVDLGDGEEIVAVVSFGDPGCRGDARLARVDLFAGFVDAVVAAWTAIGPLDPCDLDGACTDGCARADLDCPIDGPAGVTCEDALDCDGRRCVAAPEDASARFCSIACDPDADGADCPPPLGRCLDGACVYAGETPGVIGAACDDDDTCRSGICDLHAGSCAAPCGAGGACPDGFTCAPVGAGDACTVPDGGCCSTGGDPGVALVLLPWLRRRAKRRRDRRTQVVP
jgi:V8-like Glu-specific endopeptidase